MAMETSASSGNGKAKRTPYNQVILALQGGGALGAYQAGVYEGLDEAGFEVDWVVGVSIGGINASLIAGNPPDRRVARLKEFWHRMSSQSIEPPPYEPLKTAVEQMNLSGVYSFGIPGFFTPRMIPPPLGPGLSYYDTEPLNRTLTELVDFEYIAQKRVRLSLGAVNICSGKSVYFDSSKDVIGPDHVRASGALPPGFPPVEIDGEFYWDGGVSSNSPIWHIFDTLGSMDAMLLQVDLFDPQSELPQTMDQVEERAAAIKYSSKQLLSWSRIQEREELRAAVRHLIAKLPDDLKGTEDARRLATLSKKQNLGWVRIINHEKSRAGSKEGSDFSRSSVTRLWNAGRDEVRRLLRDKPWESQSLAFQGVRFFETSKENYSLAGTSS
jgi:NTE family protein